MTLGQRLKQARIKKNFTLRELASKVGIDFTYLSKIENDKTDSRPPSEDLLRSLSSALDEDIFELLALAKRIPTKIREKYYSNDKAAIQFFRSLAKKDYVTQELWKKLTEILEET